MADDLINQGLNALGFNKKESPQDHLNRRTSEVQQELNVYHNDEFVASGNPTDGDNPIPKHRLAYNPKDNPEDRGKSLDAWETSKSPEWLAAMSPEQKAAHEKKMLRQRNSYAKAAGMHVDDVTNEDVYAMGDKAHKDLIGFFGDGGRVDTEGNVMPSKLPGDDRTMGQAYLNSNGEDARAFMNTPERNANYYEKYNSRGRAEQVVGSSRLHGDEVVSDADARNTTLGYVKNLSASITDAVDDVSGGIIDAAVDGISRLVYGGEADTDSSDEDTFRRIETARKEAGKAAQLEADKQAASPEFKANQNAQLDDALNEQLTAMGADASTAPTSKVNPDLKPIDVEARTEEILRKSLNKNDLAFYEGKGTATKTVQENLDVSPEGSSTAPLPTKKVTKVEDDRYESLSKRKELRSKVNEIAGTKFDIEKGVTKGKADAVTGRPDLPKTANPILKEDAAEDSKKYKEAADKHWEEGNYGKAAYEWVKGAGNYVAKHPGASFQGAVESLPAMGYYIAAPALAITTNTHKTYEDGKDTFFKERGRLPKEGPEQNILLATSAAASVLEKFGADFALGKAGKLASEAFNKSVGKLSLGAAAGTAIIAGAGIEGLEEMTTELLKQIGTNQGKDKLIDSDAIYDSWLQGVAAGGMTKAVIASPNIPNYIKEDLSKLPKAASTVAAGVKAVQGRVEAKKQAEIDRKQAVVDSFDAKADADSGVPSKGEVLAEKVFSGFEAKAEGATKAKRAEEVNAAAEVVAEGIGKTPEELREDIVTDIDPNNYDFSQAVSEPSNDTAGTVSTDALGDQAAQEAGSTVEATETKPTEPTVEPKEALATKVQEITDLPTETFQGSDSVVTLSNQAMALDAHITKEFQAIESELMSDKITPEEAQVRFEAVQKAQEQYQNLQQNIEEQRKEAKPNTKSITSPTDVGNVLAHGSTAIKETDPEVLKELGTEMVDMVTQLKEFDSLLTAVAADTPKKMSQVTGEVLGTRVNSVGKKGLGNHMASLGAAIAGIGKGVSKEDAGRNAANVILDIDRFKRLQQSKLELIQDGLTEFKKTGKPVTVKYGYKGKETFVIENEGQTQGVIKQIKSEIGVIDKGLKLGVKLATAVFDPTEAKKHAATEQNMKSKGKKPTPAKRVTDGPKGSQSNTETGTKVTEYTNNYKKYLSKLTPQQIIDQSITIDKKIKSIETSLKTADEVTTQKLNRELKAAKIRQTEVNKLTPPWDVNPTASVEEAVQRAPNGSQSNVESVSIDYNSMTKDQLRAEGNKLSKLARITEDGTKKKQVQKDLAKVIEAYRTKQKQDEGKGTLRNSTVNTAPQATQNGKAAKPSMPGKVLEATNDLKKRIGVKSGNPKVNLNKTAIRAIRSSGLFTDTEIAALNDSKTEGRRDRLIDALDRLETNYGAYKVPEISDSTPVTEPTPSETPSETEKDAGTDIQSLLDALQAGRDVEPVETTEPNAAINDVKAVQKEISLKSHSATQEQIDAGSVVVESNSTKKLKPFFQMMEAKKSKPKGFIGLVSDLFKALKEMSTESITPQEQEAIKRIEAFSKEFGISLDKITPVVGPNNKGGIKRLGGKDGTTFLFKEDANKSPDLMMMDKHGNYPQIVKDAMSIAALEWFQAHGTSTSSLTDSDVYSFFGMDERQGGLSPTVLAEMRTKGIHSTGIAKQIGLKVLDNLNIDQIKHPDLDGNFKGRLAQALGDRALVAMASMQSNVEGEPRGYLEFSNVPVKYLNDISGQELKIGEGSRDPVANFVRVPVITDKNGRPVYDGPTMLLGKSLTELKELTDSTAFKTAMRKIIGTDRREGGVTAVPSKRIPTHVTGSSSAIPEAEKDYIRFLNSTTLVKNPMWDLMKEFGEAEDNLDLWFKMQGFEEGVLQEDGTMKYPHLHDADAISAEGKNAGIIRSHENSKQFEVDYAAGKAETEAELEQAQAMLEIHESFDTGAPTDLVGDRAKARKKILRKIKALQDELTAYEQGHIHIEHHMVKTSRAHSKGDTLSIQNDKTQRNMLSLKDGIEQINILDPAHRFAVIAGLVEPLGLNKKAFSSLNKGNAMDEFHEKFMDSEGNAKDPGMRKAIEALVKFEKGEQLSREDLEAITEVITNKKVYGLKEGMHSLSGLMVVASWSNAMKNGTYKFESYGYTEVDGTTNGVMASNRQLLGGFKIDKPEAEWTAEERAKVKRIRGLLNSGGHILKGDEYTEAMDYLQENLDAYQNLADLSAKRIHPKMISLGKVTQEKLTELRKNVKELSAKTYTEEGVDINVLPELEAAKRDLGLAIFKPTLMKSGLVTGKIDGDLRNMMKAFVMPGGYGAGDTALSNSGFFDWLGNTYKETMKHKLNSKTAEEFETAMTDINTTLKAAGVTEVTLENASKVYSKKDIETLRKLYRASIGAEITGAYRESMGDYTENAQAITTAMNVVDILNTAHLTDVMALAEKGKKGVALTNDEKSTIRKEEQKKGFFLGYRHIDATGHEDSRSFITEGKQVVSKERGGSVQTKYAKNAVKSTKWVEKDGVLVSEGVEEVSSRTSNLTEWVPEANLGSAAVPMMTIGTDATTQVHTGAAGKVDHVNVFDAKITGYLTAQEEAVITNMSWNNLMENWSMWKAVEERLDFMLENVPMSPDIESTLTEFFTPYDKGTGYGNKNAPHYLDGAGEAVYFDNLRQFTNHFKDKVKEGESQRKYTNEQIIGVAQHAHPGGTHATKYAEDNYSDSLNDYAGRYDVPPIYHGSSADQIDPNSFDESMRSVATPDRVSNLFTGYLDAANNMDSQDHKNQLQELMNNHVIPLLMERDMSLYVDTGTSELGGLNIEDKVYIRASDEGIRRFSGEMSDAEVLVHEFLHPIIEEGFKNNSKALTEATKLMEAARESDTFTVEALMDKNAIDQDLARKDAEALYDYVLGSPHEFMTYGRSNEKVRNLLASVDLKDSKAPSMVDRMMRVLDDLVRTLRGLQKRSGPTNAQQGVDAVMESFDKTTQIHLARKVAKTVNNKYVKRGRGFLADRVAKPIVEWAIATPPNHRKKITDLVKLPFQIYLPSFTKVVRENVKEATDYRHGFFAKMAKEAMGPDGVGKDFTRLLSKVNEHVESASLRVSSETSKKVKEAFNKPVTKKQWRMLTDTVLRGDMKVFGKDYTPEQVSELIRDPEVRRKAMSTIINGLTSTDKQWINNQAKNLGSVMINGEAKIANGNLNAFNIVTGVGRKQGNSGLAESDLEAVDMLKTLWAIDYMSDANRTAVADMIMAEPAGIRTMLDIDKANHLETLEGTYNGDRSRVIAGDVTAVSQTRSQTVILPRREHAKHIAAGMELVKRLPSGMALYSRTAGATEDYQKGAFSMAGTSLEGTIVSLQDYNPINDTGLLPVVAGGRIVAYRAIMDAETRRVDAGMSIEAHNSLGNHAGRNLRLQRGDNFNRIIMEEARKDYLENGRDTKAFVRIHKDSKNKQVAEFAKLMPKQMYDDMQKSWNGDMYLRESHLDLLVGYRKIAATDYINSFLKGKDSKEMSAAVSGGMRLAGDVWQDVVGEVKRRTVLFTPAVVAGNFLSNLHLSVMYGMNPVDMLRDQMEGWKAIKAYTKLQDELAATNLDLKLGRDVKTNIAKKARLELTMKSSGVHDLVDAGIFQTIVEDIDLSQDSPLLSTIGGLLPEAITEKVESTYMKAPDAVKTGIGLAMLSPSTDLGSAIQSATAYSDFMARYAMYKHLLKQGKNKQDAMDEIRDIYVDYAPNTSDKMQYINDMGGFMYTKFLLRTQRVILRALKEKPESVIALEAAQRMTNTDVPDIIDANLLGINLTGGGRTLMPGEAAETLSTLPGLHLISGLADVF